MDSSDIYYSDNSQLIDENNSEWIGNTVLIENQDITWQEDGPEITVDYSETSPDLNKTLTENDGYLTAENEDSNAETSQYFSILESNCDDAANEYGNPEDPKCLVKIGVNKEEVILPDVTKFEVEDDYPEPDDNIADGVSDDQVIVYRMEGSDELFAVQLADDGNGNFQKYKYKVRQNEDGQFEAIPGSIEIQKADQNDLMEEHDPELEDSEPKDQKPNAETLALINQQISENIETPEIDNNFYINSVDNFENINPAEYLLQSSYEQDNEEEYQTVQGVHVTADSESNSQPETMETTEFVDTNSVSPPRESSESEYEIEELDEAFQDEHINEYDEQSNHDNPQILQHKLNNDNMKVHSPEPEKELRQQLSDNHNVTIYKDDKNVSYLVVNAKEKENVALNQPTTNFNTVNLRSILKSNYSTNKLKNSTPKPEKHTPTIPAIISSKETHPKPAKESAPVNNILLKSARQPRKQTIKPVERAGSEIIVQPLVYSLAGDISDNFLIPLPGKRKRVIEEVLQVSDESDPEFTLKPKKKKIIKRNKYKYGRRGRRKNVEITIIDSDDEDELDEDDLDEEQSDESIIEVLTDQESSDKEQSIENNNKQTNDKSNSEESAEYNKKEEIQKETKNNTAVAVTSDESNKNNEATEETQIPDKPEKDLDDKSVRKSLGNKKNKCPYCPKTFPRLITLKKHMNIHSTRRSLRSRTNNIESEKKTEPEEKSENRDHGNEQVSSNSLPKSRSFNCLKCKLKFLTESQYKRHQTIHITKKSTVKKSISPLKKPDKKILISQKHLRPQNKSQIENNLKSQRLSQIKKPVVNDRKAKEIFKCEYCGQSFATRTVLIIHRNSHKTFPCPNCKTTFTAKLLLDDHLRKNCVKISHSTKKSRPKNPVKKFSPTKRINSKCEICQQIFPTPKSLQIHKNVSHKPKVRIICKSLMEDIKKPALVKKKGAHGGVPMSLKMQQALGKFKVKS